MTNTSATWGWTLGAQLVQDLRYAARTMMRNPVFPALAAFSLALGIGANTAIFSFMDALLLRALPVADPASLVVFKFHMHIRKGTDDSVIHGASGYFDDDETGMTGPIFPYPAFERLRQSNGPLSVLFAYRREEKLNVMVDQRAEITGGEYISGDFFRGLGVPPASGRLIADADDRPGAPSVVALSYAFAQRRFGDPSNATGQTIDINNHPFTVIGVAAPAFFGVDPRTSPDLYLPLHADLLLDTDKDHATPLARFEDDHYYWTEMMGRLRPGVSLAQAQLRLAPIFDSWVAATATTNVERSHLPHLDLQPGSGGVDRLRNSYAEPLILLLIMVGLILAIACANIANLLLARSAARCREMAVRLSIGASRSRVIRQLFTESLLLALLGGAAGILFANWGIEFLRKQFAADTPFIVQPELSVPVLAAALALTFLTGILFGLAPALHAARVDPMPVLKNATNAPRPRRAFGFRFNLGKSLIVAQLAISLLLIVGANLFLRTLANLQSLDSGFDRNNILLFRVNARQAGHRDPEILTFYSNLESRLAAIPGVRGATMANNPLIGAGAWGWAIAPADQPRPAKAPTGHGSGFSRSATRVLAVAPGFFSTMRIPLLAGREFTARDRAGTQPVAIVNEAWAKVNLAGSNTIGRVAIDYGLHTSQREVEIVGLARNARYDNLTGDFPAIVYLPIGQSDGESIDDMTYFLRTAGAASSDAAAIREIVHQADPRIPVAALTTQTAQIDAEIVDETVFARLSAAFALLSLAIACVGLYGATSYAVARRTSEIGVRMALGARRGAIVWMVLRDVLMLAGLGLAIGLPIAVAASKVVGSLLFDVQPGDPWALASAFAILLGAALAAAYIPARKASLTDPMMAIRHE